MRTPHLTLLLYRVQTWNCELQILGRFAATPSRAPLQWMAAIESARSDRKCSVTAMWISGFGLHAHPLDIWNMRVFSCWYGTWRFIAVTTKNYFCRPTLCYKLVGFTNFDYAKWLNPGHIFYINLPSMCWSNCPLRFPSSLCMLHTSLCCGWHFYSVFEKIRFQLEPQTLNKLTALLRFSPSLQVHVGIIHYSRPWQLSSSLSIDAL